MSTTTVNQPQKPNNNIDKNNNESDRKIKNTKIRISFIESNCSWKETYSGYCDNL